MNKMVPPAEFQGPEPHRSTQGAQDWSRLHWTIEKFDKATELGLFGPRDRIELIHGELVPMAAKGNRHERVRDDVLNWIADQKPKDVRFASEPGWRVRSDVYLEPDIIVYDGKSRMPAVPADQILLGIEVAHSSLKWDLGPRSVLLASLGLRSYWVIDAQTLVIHSFDGLLDGNYTVMRKHKPSKLVTPPLVPMLALRMADLGIDG